MNKGANRPRLSPDELFVRGGVLLSLVLFAAGLRLIRPEMLAWLPFRTSCGAATGLPCIFCGMTRALHHLLNGEFVQALYFNWIAFPFCAFIILATLRLGAELILQRHIPLSLPALRVTPRTFASGAAVLFTLWILQVWLALCQHKGELLNPNGVLYALVAR